MKYDLLFYTVATRRYKMFVTPFILFALYHNRNAKAEILVGDAPVFMQENSKAMDVLNRYFPGRITIRPVSETVDGATMRFTSEPLAKLKYTYMLDIDILIMESEIVRIHREIMAEVADRICEPVIFSNRMRGDRKLTGVHFVQTDPYYRLTADVRAKTKLRDEEALHDIVRRGVGNPEKYASDKRPVHGFHISLHRAPVPEPGHAGWKLRPPKYQRRYAALKKRPIWRDVSPLFAPEFKDLLRKAEASFDAVNKRRIPA